MNEDLNIVYPPFVECLLDQSSETYSCFLTLGNQSNHSLYFYIASTFGLYMKESTETRHIHPNESITLSFNFRSTNIISQNQQFICISIGPSKLAQLCSIPSSQKVIVHLKFNETFVDDPMIEAIVLEEVNYLIGEGEGKEKKGEHNQARNKYEQAFQLLRKCEMALYGMAVCSFTMNKWGESLRDIETALLYDPDNARFQFLKARLLFNFYGACKTWQRDVIEYCLNLLKEIQLNKKSMLAQNQKSELTALMKSIEESPYMNRMTVLKRDLLAKALSHYSENQAIGKYYSSKADLERQLKEIFLSDEPQENATPDFIIDPISYQIMSTPLILPSGHSFEQKTLQVYFQKNGYKDPITRKDTYPQWVFHNHSLRDLIKDHPKLTLWKQYEYDLVYK